MEKDNGLIRLCYHDIFTKHPVVALPLRPALAGDLDEAFVEREVVPDGVLPALAVLTLQQAELYTRVTWGEKCDVY